MKSNETYQQEANSYLGSCQRLLKRLENAKAAHEKRRQAMMRGYGHEPDKADYEHDEKGHAR